MPTNPTKSRCLRALTSAVAAVGLLGASLTATPALAAPSADKPDAEQHELQQALESPKSFEAGRHFVILKDEPLATYDGGKSGFPATAAAEDETFSPDTAAAQRYEGLLERQQEAVAGTASIEVQTSFTVALNAFVADLSAEEALALSSDPRVLSVAPDEQLSMDYSSTEFLGLPGPNGTWNTTYGGVEEAGEGVVVGVIDSGIYPDQEFLAGEEVGALSGQPQVGEPYLDGSGRIAMLKADGTTYRGTCQTGEDFAAEDCSTKLVGARYFSAQFEQMTPPENRAPEERISPLDVSSHGTHVATTAAGNAGVEQRMDGASYGTGSGVAPEAKIAAYKVCWEDTDPNTGGCYSSASVAAIEAGIVDNVDVLNYSISGSNNSIVDPVALAFKSAAEAGIFVSTSAGNSGPAANTVNHSSPWLTTVAAHTFSNELTGTIEFTDGTKVRGVSAMAVDSVGPADVVLSTEVGRTGAPAEEVRLCYPNSLNAEQAAGKIVLCDRGGNARAEKSQVVADAGGVGMILVNVGGGSEDADKHAVPTVHTSDESVREKVRTTDVQASLVRGDTTGLPQPPLPQIAGFSSRGPSNAVNSEFLKPDMAAPGVNVLAGVSALDENHRGDTFGLMSGTSMSSPNLAGMAALMSGQHPDWSPMAIKSAMMTTAGTVRNADGSANLDNFATGAGSADPEAMSAPGLVYESDARQWDALLLGAMPGRDVNLASISVPDVLGSATVQRTVTATQAGTWAAQAEVPGFSVQVSPAIVSLAKGESAEVAITFTRTTAEHDAWQHGSLTWVKPAGQSVTSPVTLRAVDVRAVDEMVEGQGASGSVDVELRGGVDGQLTPSVDGLALANTDTFTKSPGGTANSVENANNRVQTITVGQGVESLVLDQRVQDEGDDWDLYVLTPQGQQLTQATAAAGEHLTIPNPAPGNYLVISHLFSSGDGAEASASLESVQLAGDAGNLTVSPNPVPVTQGETTRATLAWSGLTEGAWKGVVTWAPGVQTTVSVTVGAVPVPVCDQPDFRDNTDQGRYYHEGVRWMQCAGISRGYANGTYGVGRDISRGESVAFLYRYVDPDFTAPGQSPFSDVATDSTHFTPITWAVEANVAEGYTDDTFRQHQDVTRGEFAAFVYRALEDEDYTAPAEAPFSDVPVGSTHHEAISWLKAEGLTSGRADGSYGVNTSISRQDVAVYLHRYAAAQ